MLREEWVETHGGPIPPSAYVTTLRKKLRGMEELAKTALVQAQVGKKRRYDTKVQAKEFTPWQQILLLLPSSENKLQVAGALQDNA